MSEISVFGSINMDLVINLDNFPRPGQTIKAKELGKTPGGKGANQAVAAAELGGKVSMYGALGNDNYADALKKSLHSSKVKTARIERKPVSSGLAIVMVNKKAENEIVIVSGANEMVDESYANKVFKSISDSKVLLLQLETPLKGIKKLLSLLPNGRGPKVILDPAPAISLSKIPLQRIDILTPNERELETLATSGTIDATIEKILKTDTSIVIKRGENGAKYISPKTEIQVPSYDVTPIDTTGAGDVFNGALGVAFSENMKEEDAVEFANAAGAIATLGKGAQPSSPTRRAIKKFKDRN